MRLISLFVCSLIAGCVSVKPAEPAPSPAPVAAVEVGTADCRAVVQAWQEALPRGARITGTAPMTSGGLAITARKDATGFAIVFYIPQVDGDLEAFPGVETKFGECSLDGVKFRYMIAVKSGMVTFNRGAE